MTLSARSRVVLDTMLPSEAHPLLRRGVFDAGFDSFYQDFEASAVLSLRLTFLTALFAATWVAPLLIRRLPPITRYSRETRERALLALEHSPLYLLRQMSVILKTVICLRYGADPAVRAAIGYPVQQDAPRLKDSRVVLP